MSCAGFPGPHAPVEFRSSPAPGLPALARARSSRRGSRDGRSGRFERRFTYLELYSAALPIDVRLVHYMHKGDKEFLELERRLKKRAAE